jgi:hypothetical protein
VQVGLDDRIFVGATGSMLVAAPGQTPEEIAITAIA